MDRGKRIGELICKIAEGDESAYSELSELVTPTIKSIGYSITYNIEDAKDVVQETLLTIAKQAKHYHESGNGWAWIIKIAENHSYKLLKHRKRNSGANVDNNHKVVSEQDIVDHIFIKDAFKKLSQEERLLLAGHYWLGMSYHEIAQSLNMSESTTRRKILGILDKIKSF